MINRKSRKTRKRDKKYSEFYRSCEQCGKDRDECICSFEEVEDEYSYDDL